MSDFINLHRTILSLKQKQIWIILSLLEISIYKKINKYGVELPKWNLNINRGILTGYNDAFIIDEETKNKLIRQNPKCADIIRPYRSFFSSTISTPET